ncbi:MAG: alanyl-tRNA editing protein [Clostridiales bacterium]|jgi:alanyl-tRNA synthetase|nr:alanyl-tRNA editing protein [Clostridiales bacterium]
MGTKKLYYEDSLLTRFSTLVLKCRQCENGYKVVLASTCFYPEGGGQPSDVGRLGGVNITDVQEEGDEIVHETDGPLEPGTIVFGQVYWERRFLLMQHHTAEHILSGLINSKYGYDNVGFHMNTECVTMDISGELDDHGLTAVEQTANRVVHQNIPVETKVYPPGALKIPEHRSKRQLEGDVRIVAIPGYDTCACCGLHCVTTGQIGAVKITEAKRYKGGMRLVMLAGKNALADYDAKNRSVYEISALLSVKTGEVTMGVKRLMSENADLKQQLSVYRKEIFENRAKQVPMGTPIICLFESDLPSDELRRFCMILCERAEVAAVFSGNKYAVGSKTCDMLEFAKDLNKELNGRGGGGKQLIQGTVSASRGEIERFFNIDI